MLATYENAFCLLLLIHFVADFFLQTPWMAKNKSDDLQALGLHVAVYTVTLYVLGLIAMRILGMSGLELMKTFLFFALANGALHFVTDFITSRASAHQWEKMQSAVGDEEKGHYSHNFFVVIGLDQVVHYTCLFFTIPILLGPVA